MSDAPAYDASAIEARWEAAWRERAVFATGHRDKARRRAHVFVACRVGSDGVGVRHARSYVLGDAYARLRRAQGSALLFTSGFCVTDLDTGVAGASPDATVKQHSSRVRKQLNRLGCSFDWSRTFATSEPDLRRWTQWLFLALLDGGLVYRGVGELDSCDQCRVELAAAPNGERRCPRCGSETRRVRPPQWFLRARAYQKENDRRLAALSGWSIRAADGQEAALGRVDGVELEARTVNGRSLIVFTPHPDAVDRATFVGISPRHPDIEDWVSEPQARQRFELMEERGWQPEPGAVAAVHTAVFVRVPNVDHLLPVVVSSSVDARFGPTAVLGIPELEEEDRPIGERLPLPASMEVRAGRGSPQPAVRYRSEDIPISRPLRWGTPVPVVHCAACGAVPVPAADLPTQVPSDRPESMERPCPACDRQAGLDRDALDTRFERIWTWLAPCVPRGGRSEELFAHPQLERCLPVDQLIAEVDESDYVFAQRLLAKALRDRQILPCLADGEPFTRALVHEPVRVDEREVSEHVGDLTNLDDLVARLGADTVRLALLYGAAPRNSFPWNDQVLRHCHRFLGELMDYAEPRLRRSTRNAAGSIDTSDRPRRRLATWCRVAVARVTEDMEDLEMHRAVSDVMRFLTRIRDFESAVRERREALDERDWEALRHALLLLVRLLTPLAPHVAEELWAAAGNKTLLSATPWPAPQAPPQGAGEPA